MMATNHQKETGLVASKGIEQALHECELNYRRLFEAARDGILILDAANGVIMDANPFLSSLLGFSHDEMLGKTVAELSPFKDIESNKVMLERLQSEGYVRYEDLPLETRDGRKVAVEFISNVYLVEDKKVIQCNIRDISERKKLEKERARLAAIIESSEDAIVTKTASGIVIGWNQGAERLYGYTAEEIIGHSVSMLFPPEYYDEYLRIMAEIRAGKVVPSFDTVRRRKDGAEINVSVCIAPIETRDGTVVGASKISHDITRIKKLEAQVIESQKMEVIGQLAAGVAHDFNNILGVIMGYSSLMLEETGLSEGFKSKLETIQSASERAAGLTRQLLIFSRKQVVEPVVLDLGNVIKDLDKILRRLIDENIQLTITPPKETGYIKADSGYVGQVLMNLVVNARDAMPNGGKLHIASGNVTLPAGCPSAPAHAAPGNYVVLSVQDTGTGMTEEVKAHLFEAFFTTKPKGKGTGLGLATCRTIVEQCRGYIMVSSEIGQGSTFKIYFPRVEEAPSGCPQEICQGPLPRGKATLLVVEDDHALRKLAKEILESQGYEVLSAQNGQDALQVADSHRGHPISLVITDIIMPIMGGKQMAEWLKTTSPNLRILFTSGYTDDTIVAQGVLEPDVAFLSKPYTPATLSRKVHDILEKSDCPPSS